MRPFDKGCRVVLMVPPLLIIWDRSQFWSHAAAGEITVRASMDTMCEGERCDIPIQPISGV